MNNGDVIYDGRRLAAYAIAEDFCADMGWDSKFLKELWEVILLNPALYDEFIYYLNKNELLGLFKFEGYSIVDLYFYHLYNYNLRHDIGKNPDLCNKDELVFLAFHTMSCLMKEPEKYKKILGTDIGMDMF